MDLLYHITVALPDKIGIVMSATNAAAGGIPFSQHGQSAFSYISHSVDPLDKIAPSTVAMFFFFGSLTFATVGMACRALLHGDKQGMSSLLKFVNRFHFASP